MRVVLEIGDWILAEDDEGEVRLWSNNSTGETRSYEDMPIEVEAKLREKDHESSVSTSEAALEATLSPMAPPTAIEPVEPVKSTGATEQVPFRRQRGVAAAPNTSASVEPLPVSLPSLGDTALPNSFALVESTSAIVQLEPPPLDGTGFEVEDGTADYVHGADIMQETGNEMLCAESQEPAPEVPRPANLPNVPERTPTPATLAGATSMRQHQGQSQLQFLGTLTHLHLGRKGLTSLGSAPQLCGRLKVLNLEGNHLQEIQDMKPNCSFEVLHMQGNDVWNLSTWTQSLPSLRVLDVSENRLAIVSGLDQSRRLEELNLRGQKCNSPLQLHPPTLRVFARSLRNLDISRNRITDISPVAVLSALERFEAVANLLSEISSIGDVLASLGRLRRVNFKENPVGCTFKYRDMVILAASDALEELDEKAVQRHEKAFLMKMHERRKRSAESESSKGSTPTAMTPGDRNSSQRRSSSLVPLPPKDQMVPAPGHPPVASHPPAPCSNRSRSTSRDPTGRQYRRKSSGPARLPPLPPRIGS